MTEPETFKCALKSYLFKCAYIGERNVDNCNIDTMLENEV